MSEQELFLKLVSALKLLKIHVMETGTKHLADPEPSGAEFKYKLDQLMGDNDPLPIEANQLVFRIKFEMQCRSGETDIANIMIAFIVLFEKIDEAVFEDLWSQEPLRRIFENQQLKKTLWPYVRQFVTESLQRLELPVITLPWLI